MNKESIYHEILISSKSLLESESNLIANLANVTALLKEKLGHFWIGFYLVDNYTNELVLGPFQGTLACTRIPFGRGVCGKSWKLKETLVVPNVHEFEGHIACSSLSNSEIVIPIVKENEVVAVLDIDSTSFSTFDAQDKIGLEALCIELAKLKFY